MKLKLWHRLVLFLSISAIIVAGSFYLINHVFPGFSFTQSPPIIKHEYKAKDKNFLSELFKGCNWFNNKGVSIKACNYTNPIVRTKAVQLAGKFPGELNIGQVCEIYDFLRQNWKYINDSPNRDYISPASETINNGFHGDCDDFAIVLTAMLSSIGAESRFNYAQNDESGHAFSEINIGYFDSAVIQYLTDRYYFDSDIYYREDSHGFWLNLDWFAHHPGGEYFKYTKGVSYYPLDDYCEKF